MTEEYAKLSIRAGFLARTIDEALGGTGLVPYVVRRMAWDLTPAFLEAMKETAIQQGIPEKVLEAAELEAAMAIGDQNFLDAAMLLQDEVDRGKRKETVN